MHPGHPYASGMRRSGGLQSLFLRGKRNFGRRVRSLFEQDVEAVLVQNRHFDLHRLVIFRPRIVTYDNEGCLLRNGTGYFRSAALQRLLCSVAGEVFEGAGDHDGQPFQRARALILARALLLCSPSFAPSRVSCGGVPVPPTVRPPGGRGPSPPPDPPPSRRPPAARHLRRISWCHSSANHSLREAAMIPPTPSVFASSSSLACSMRSIDRNSRASASAATGPT